MKNFLIKCVYYGTLIMPIYRFVKDICVTGYAIYINHLQEIETAKMRAQFNSDQLQEVPVEQIIQDAQKIIKKGKKQ